MKILRACRLVLAQTGLSNEKFACFTSRNVSPKYIRFISLSIQLSHMLMQMYHCIRDYSNGITAILLPFHLVIAATVQLFVYFSLILQSDQIAELLNFIQRVVDERMEYSSLYVTMYSYEKNYKLMKCVFFWV